MTSDECPRCGERVEFLDGDGPFCAACGWRSDDPPRPVRTDGGRDESSAGTPQCERCGVDLGEDAYWSACGPCRSLQKREVFR